MVLGRASGYKTQIKINYGIWSSPLDLSTPAEPSNLCQHGKWTFNDDDDDLDDNNDNNDDNNGDHNNDDDKDDDDDDMMMNMIKK